MFSSLAREGPNIITSRQASWLPAF